MTKEEAKNILAQYVKACREDDMLTLEEFSYEEVIEAMSMGAEALSEPSLPSDLEEAAEKSAIKYAEDTKPKDADGEVWRIGDVMIENRMSYEDGFIAGANWQKERMMEGAVEGEVCILPGGIAYVKEKNNETLKQHLLDNFKTGDKVRIIIVNEDKE